MSKLIIEDLKMVKEYKIYQNKGPGKPSPLGFDQSICLGGGIWQFMKFA